MLVPCHWWLHQIKPYISADYQSNNDFLVNIYDIALCVVHTSKVLAILLL